MGKNHYLAFDIGASSGRAIIGTLEEGKANLVEVHRFANEMSFENGHYHWDIHHLFAQLKEGLRKCIHDHNIVPDSISIDTWGVDFGLLDENNKLIGLPFAYRDSITDTAMEEVFKAIEPYELYKLTGIQFMKFNSIFQLWAIKKTYPDLLAKAKKMLFMPDLLGFMFTGKLWSEQTIASTSQMIDPEEKTWLKPLIDELGLPTDILQDIVAPGTVIGPILPEIQEELSCGPISFVASCAHDTGAAIAAIPASGADWAYISSGTWSLMGMELDKPILNQDAFDSLFTNEGGFASTTRFLKNITGLWLLQECKRIFDQTVEYSYSELVELSQSEPAFRTLLDPDDPAFMNPPNMLMAIKAYCTKTKQNVPGTVGQFARCIFESLAMKYKYTLDLLTKATSSKPSKPSKLSKLHIIGGGTKNEILCQYTANATGLKVIAGPTEGAALGNILVQAHASGKLEGIEEIRKVTNDSVETKTYLPEDTEEWADAYKRWLSIIKG